MSLANWPNAGELCFSPAFGNALGDGSIAVLTAFAALALAIWIYGFRYIDVNRTSLHGYYRDRLSEAYLFQLPKNSRRPTVSPDGSAETVRQNDRQLLGRVR